MCGRYGLTVGTDELYERYQLSPDDYSMEATEEIFPTNKKSVLLPNGYIYDVKWGFTPSFAKRPLINARAETILEKPTFREPFSRKRCIIPATYFYEWDAEKTKKLIAVKDLPIFSMAGICERYDGELTYSIITTESNDQMASIHDRMPVILKAEDERTYLDLQQNPYDLLDMLKPTDYELVIEDI